MRHLRALLGATVGAVALAATATAAAPSMTLMPASVKRGAVVAIRGSAGGCAVGNTVFVISRAFPHVHDFAGLPAVLGKVRPNGRYRARTRIPARKKPGRYRVTARCGGGNLGVVRHLTVRS